MNTTITGTIKRINGDIVPNAVIRITLPNTAYVGGEAFVSASIAEVVADGKGNFSLTITPNSVMSTRSPMILEIFENTQRLDYREIYIPEVENTNLETIVAYSKQLLFVRPDNKMQGVFITEDDTTASFEFIGPDIKPEEITVKVGMNTYTIPVWMITGG